MPSFSHLFLESPWPIYLVAGLAELVTAALWQSRRSGAAKVLLLVWPLAAAGVGILAYAVDTPSEKVRKTWNRIEAAVARRDVPAILSEVADDFASDRTDKQDLEKLAVTGFQALGPDAITFRLFRIKKADPLSATAEVFASSNMIRETSLWEVTFAPQADGAWRVTGATCLDPRGRTIRDAVRYLDRI